VAGFSFDAEASEIIQESAHSKLKVHMAHIRPDISPGMDGLLKEDTRARDQLFTVFGQPEINVRKVKEGMVEVELKGVDIYDPLKGEVRSSGADKVAAWFLDGDYDGRCFCITQAFFPDQDAWEKIAKSLGSSADASAFEALQGTVSIPFKPGHHQRIAVKVIDPRGNEVMAIASLADKK
jgi:adenine-specific DNA-methyltransferase